MSKEEFNKVWSETSKEKILNQYYYDYTYLQNLKQALNEIRDYINIKKITKDGVFLVKESTWGQEILQIIDNVLGDSV